MDERITRFAIMNISLENLSTEFNDNVKFDYDLKKKNWFNIGGKSKIYFIPIFIID